MFRKLGLVLFAAVVGGAPTMANAGVYCPEAVTQAILHANGGVFFTSDATCPNWCQVNWGTDAKNKNALAMLLTAVSSGQKVTFYWPNLTSCAATNVTYASPDSMHLLP